MFGKDLTRQALTQITDLVGIGKGLADQTKITNGIRSVSEDLGREW